MFGYEFSSIIVVKSTRNQVTGYELTSPLQVRVDFTGTGLHRDGSTWVQVSQGMGWLEPILTMDYIVWPFSTKGSNIHFCDWLNLLQLINSKLYSYCMTALVKLLHNMQNNHKKLYDDCSKSKCSIVDTWI